MNKEQVQKHGEVIKWFCDNTEKGVWVKQHGQDFWVKTTAPCWDLDIPYVQNDGYAEYRKALVDGKTIQYRVYNKSTNLLEWVDCDFEAAPNIDSLSLCDYRIKPDETTFKVGEYVLVPAWNSYEGDIKALAIITEVSPYKVDVLSNNWQRCTRSWEATDDIDVELWTPTEEEWVCTNNGDFYSVFKHRKDIDCAHIDQLMPLEFISTLKDK
jgi:hypothetical protein